MKSIEDVLRLIRKGRTQEALDAFPEYIEDPQFRQEALGHRAWLFRNEGRYEEAIADYEIMRMELPDDLFAQALLAETYLFAGQIDKCVELTQSIVQQDPLNALAVDTLKKCHEAMDIKNPLERAQYSFTAESADKNFSINNIIEILEKDERTFPGSICPEIGRLLYSLIRCMRPDVVLETGTLIGYSALCIAQAMEDNDHGHLHFFDLFVGVADYSSEACGECPDNLEASKRHIAKAGLSRRVSFHKGDSASNILKLREKDIQFDIAFIDGDHSMQGTLNDWLAVDKVLTENGLILMHDVNSEHCHYLGPRYLLEQLNTKSPNQYRWVEMPTLDGPGLAILQKNRSGATPDWKPSLYDVIIDKIHHYGTQLK